MPTKTTEGRNIWRVGLTEICRATESLKECGTPVAKLSPARASENAKSGTDTQSYTDTISSHSTGGADSKIVYAVNVANSYGRSAGLSNRAEVPAAPTLAPPQDFRALLSGEGVRLAWIPASEAPETADLRFVYRIYRRAAGTNVQVVAGEVPVSAEAAPSFLDSSIEWEKTYNYHATVATLIKQSQGTEQQVEGDDTPEVTIVAHDVFPPAIPSGLEAGFSGPGQKPFIDLVWTPDTDADLAGYNVYRSENASESIKVNTDLVRSPAFRDTAVVPGHEYTYSISAVDARGNESAHSRPATEKVPEQ
jgi:antitoxin (DNA-binding transcriptional repressor) of toxin-antitoxin stability system